MAEKKFVFIVGVGRSGTSLLQSMFAAHPEVSALPESSFLRRYVFSNHVPVATLHSDPTLSRIDGLADFEDVGVRGWRAATLQHYLAVMSNSTKPVVLDKDPRLVEYIGELNISFPGSRIVHIFRDPRDVLLSKKKAAWSKGRSLINYLVASKVQLADARKASEKNMLAASVKYESLIKNPQQELRVLCDAVGVSFSPAMLEFSGAAKKLVQPNELSWKKETLEPVNAHNSNKWKSELTDLEALSSVICVATFCKEAGYDYRLRDYSVAAIVKALVICFVVTGLAVTYKAFRWLKKRALHVKG